MPAKEIKELRQSGKLDEALNLAKAELQAEPDNIWTKRNISWVYYDYLKQNARPELFDSFLHWLSEIRNLNLPAEEKMLFDHLSWQIGTIVFKTFNTESADFGKMMQLLDITKSFPVTRPSEGYSFLFKAFHRALKDTPNYVEFADWWDFSNFRPEDFEKEKLLNGKEIMATAEQAYIAYARHLLPKIDQSGAMHFDQEKAAAFLPKLAEIAERYPRFQYPPYFQAKLLLALGDKEDTLSALLPFVKKKQNDFWAWDVLGDAFESDPDKKLACYCKALSCRAPEEMLVNLRQRMAGLLIERSMFSEAKTEIEKLIHARSENGWKTPAAVLAWQSQAWYASTQSNTTNNAFYKKYIPVAEALLFSDIPEELIIVDFVNSDKKILNFIASENKFGFFKYERFLKDVKVGDVLKVRFQSGKKGEIFQIYTVIKTTDQQVSSAFLKHVEGTVRINPGHAFGFLDDVFVHPSIISKHKLSNGSFFKGAAIKTYNKQKQNWAWKIISDKE